jgi:hypothetical protein
VHSPRRVTTSNDRRGLRHPDILPLAALVPTAPSAMERYLPQLHRSTQTWTADVAFISYKKLSMF